MPREWMTDRDHHPTRAERARESATRDDAVARVDAAGGVDDGDAVVTVDRGDGVGRGAGGVRGVRGAARERLESELARPSVGAGGDRGLCAGESRRGGLAGVVKGTIEIGERAVWENSGASAKHDKESEVLSRMDAWAEKTESETEEKRTRSTSIGRSSWLEIDAERAQEDARRATMLATLERQFPERGGRRRGVLAGRDDDGDSREMARKKREEVLLQIDSTLASIADPTVVASNVGDGSAAACVTPVVSWFQSQSIFLRAGIAFVIACTIVAVVLIEYLAEEATSGDGFFLAEVGRATRLDASPPGALDA